MAGQLNLFKSKRQRGITPPPASEFALHCAVADAIRRWIMPGWRYTHIASGEKRDVVTAARLKRMGVIPGWPDLMFFHADGKVCFLELKRRGGRFSIEQGILAAFLNGAGHAYAWANDFKQAVEILKTWGVVRAGVEVQ